jgi:uncharacterized protein (TIGR04222 family)
VGTQYEREFLEVAFPSGDNQASLNHAMSRLMTKWRFIVRSVRQELVQAGLVDPDRQRRRTVLLSAGGIAIAVATLPLFLGATAKSEPLLGGMLITSGIAAMLLGAGLFALGASLRPWTATGAAAAAQWQAFVRYLRSLAKGRTPMPASDVIEKLWPYAAAFGIGRTLVSQATATSGFIAPPWFAAFAGQQADGGDSFAAFIVSSDMNASTGDSGGGVSDGGGGGASGGGDSGAS